MDTLLTHFIGMFRVALEPPTLRVALGSIGR